MASVRPDPLGRVFTPDPANRHHPLNNGRAAWWLALPGLDGGTRLHDLMGLHPATLNSFGSGAGWMAGTNPGGSADLAFDGSASYLSATTSPAFDTAQGTMGGWFRTSQSVSGPYPFICGRANATGSFSGITVVLNTSTGRLAAYIQNVSVPALTLVPGSGAALNDGAWHRWALAWDQGSGATCRSFVDGLPYATGTTSGSWSFAGQPFRAGISADSFWTPWAGRQADLFWSSRPWTAADAWSDYDLARAGYPGALNRVKSRVHLLMAGTAPPPTYHGLALAGCGK